MTPPDSYTSRQIDALQRSVRLIRDILRSDATDDIAYLLEDLDEACEEME